MTNYILNENSATFYHNGQVLTLSNDHQNWDKVLERVKEDNFEGIEDLINIEIALSKNLSAVGSKISIVAGAFYYNDKVVDNALTKRIIAFVTSGLPTERLERLFLNIEKNPSYRSREQLFGFLSSNNLPITEDGCFIAYKRVREDYKDVYSNTIDNSIGQTVSVERREVDDDPNRTCSHGLHVASIEYLKHYSGTRLVAVAVNPEHVVSVPTDYNNSKMRVCQYTVLEELPIELVDGDKDAWDSPAYDYPDVDEDDEADEDAIQDYYD